MTEKKPPKRDWDAFEGKLGGGKLVEKAAEEAGIPLEEALAHLEQRRPTGGYDDDSMRILAAEALFRGLRTLMKAADDSKGRMVSEGSAGGSITYRYDDVDAAKKLVDTGLKLRTLLGAAKARAHIPDLFDTAPEKTDWGFKEIG